MHTLTALGKKLAALLYFLSKTETELRGFKILLLFWVLCTDLSINARNAISIHICAFNAVITCFFFSFPFISYIKNRTKFEFSKWIPGLKIVALFSQLPHKLSNSRNETECEWHKLSWLGLYTPQSSLLSGVKLWEGNYNQWGTKLKWWIKPKLLP